MLDIKAKDPKINRTFSLSMEVLDIITGLAQAYGATQVSVVETIMRTYGKKALDEKLRELDQGATQ